MQKKIAALTLALVLALSMAVSAVAVELRYNSTIKVTPALSISGTTANCGFSVLADSGAAISVDMALYRVVGSETEVVTSWSTKEGTSSLSFTGTHSVKRGQEYMLTLNISVDGPGGKDSIYKTTSATC